MSQKYAVINATASGDTTVVSAVSGCAIVVLNYTILTSADVNVTFKSGTTAITGPMALAAYGGVSPIGNAVTFMGNNALFACNPGEDLKINLSATATVGGHCSYTLQRV